MGCKRQIIRTAKWAGKLLGSIVLSRITNIIEAFDMVTLANPGWITNHEKRRIVIQTAKNAYEHEYGVLQVAAAGEFESAVRIAIEHVLRRLRAGAPPAEIVDNFDADVETDENA